jgi:type I restriction enzyme S subunit
MNSETFCEHFATFAEAPNGIERLRELILELAVQGKLVPQNPDDEPAIRFLWSTDDDRRVDLSSKLLAGEASDVSRNNRFSIPESWDWARIGQLGETQTGTTPKSGDHEAFGSDYPFIKPADILRDRVVYDNVGLSRTGVGKYGRVATAGSVLMVCIGTIGKCNVITRDCSFNQQINSITPLPQVNSSLLLYFLQSRYFQTEAWQRSTSTTISLLNKGNWESIPIPIPPLAEQQRIVEKVDHLLGLCDELAARQAAQREKRQRLVGETLDRLVSPQTSRHLACPGGLTVSAPLDSNTTGAKANEPPGQARWRVMQDDAHRLRNHFDQLFDTPTTIPQLRQTILQLAVQGQLVPQDPNDEPAKCLRKRLSVFATELLESGRTSRRKPLPVIDESDVPFLLPEHWVWVRFGELAAEVEYGTSQKASEIGGDVPVLRMNAIRDGKVVLEESKFVASTIKDLPKLYLKNGDILFNRTNSYELVGKSGVFYGPYNKFTFASYLIRGSLLPELLPEFITIAMNAKYYRTTQIEPEVTQQCGQANFNGTKLQHSLIPLPPLAEQKRIVTKVTELLSLCDALEAKLTQAESASTQLLSAAVQSLLNGAT